MVHFVHGNVYKQEWGDSESDKCLKDIPKIGTIVNCHKSKSSWNLKEIKTSCNYKKIKVLIVTINIKVIDKMQ